MIGSIVARGLIALTGLIVAALGASVFFSLATLAPLWPLQSESQATELSVAMFFVAVVSQGIALSLAGPAALLALLAAEIAALRSWLYHAGAGLAVMLAGMLTFDPREGEAVSHLVWGEAAPALLASGALAGLTYWAIAGRRAGEGLGRRAGA